MSESRDSLRIMALEPYAALSHRAFLEGLRRHSRHAIALDLLPARKWKWRMRTSALHYAPRIGAQAPFDLLLASDFVNLAELLALLPQAHKSTPAVIYFHENQLTYPLPEYDERDYHFALIHIYSILAATRTLFNSEFHRRNFFAALPPIVDLFPDVDCAALLAALEARTAVLPFGTDAEAGTPRSPGSEPPILLWNHRWEHDKRPEVFLAALAQLVSRKCRFRVRMLGQRFRFVPDACRRMAEVLGDRLELQPFVEERGAYLDAVRGAHVVVSTARQEFFGLGTLEAIRCGLFPVLPADLAYPELLPAELRGPPFLYGRAAGDADANPDDVALALERAIDLVARDESLPERRQLIAFTDRFRWSVLAPRFDACFEEAAAAPRH
ncbi:MAG: DUF3524 domain-containing protein [Planctomycetes bacterium]|nr:DUF3524 domain-containing protein [Planctomycetota bacterium]